jgi:hypothetical protein
VPEQRPDAVHEPAVLVPKDSVVTLDLARLQEYERLARSGGPINLERSHIMSEAILALCERVRALEHGNTRLREEVEHHLDALGDLVEHRLDPGRTARYDRAASLLARARQGQ